LCVFAREVIYLTKKEFESIKRRAKSNV